MHGKLNLAAQRYKPELPCILVTEATQLELRDPQLLNSGW